MASDQTAFSSSESHYFGTIEAITTGDFKTRKNKTFGKMKHLSSIADDVIHRCAQKLDTTAEALVEEFEAVWKPETGSYSRKLVEFCSSRAVSEECRYVGERITDGSFSRFTFDVMLAWEKPSAQDEDASIECEGKEREDKRIPAKVSSVQDDISLFYSDIMPLLVNNEPSVDEDAFVWFGSLVPLAVDVVNGRFTFESLTAPTGTRLFYPAYDRFLKEIDQCVKNLQKQAKPKGVELADDEFILVVDGTASTQRVIRHIGGTSWPGRLTLTNYALYFEASGVVTYEDAIEIDLSKDVDHTVKSAATGPWGAPLFDKAILYEAPELSEGIVLEFPEVTSSTRRDHMLSLVREIMLMHQFLRKYKVESPLQVWEMHSRTILGILRLHAAREMLRIAPPPSTRFLIFALFEEVPKGDYVLQELAESLKTANSAHPYSASSILRILNTIQPVVSPLELKGETEEYTPASGPDDNLSALDSAVNQAREESKVMDVAKSTAERLKEEGVGESVTILMELLKPVRSLVPWFQEVISWERPATTVMVISATLLIAYKEWIGKALAVLLVWAGWKMLRARLGSPPTRSNEIVVSTSSDQKSTIENIVSAQYGLRTAHEIMQTVNISILKIWSLMCYKAPKQSDTALAAISVAAIVLAILPFKYIIMVAASHFFLSTSKLGKYLANEQGNRRLQEWWDSIPIAPVRIVNNA